MNDIPGQESRDRRWILVDRPGRADLLRAHLPGVIVTVPVFLAARFYPFREHPVITCRFRQWTGYPCAGCGYTRAFQAIAHGRLADAASDCPAALLLFAGLALILAWNLTALVLRRRIRPGPRLMPGPRAFRWWIAAGIVLVLANWIWRLAHGLA